MLFLGNSFTSVNDLPFVFEQLAESGGHAAGTDMIAPGGATLEDHRQSPDTADRLGSQRWDFVVLQEQSQIPSVASMREAQMYPAAGALITEIQAHGATPLLFSTWAHQGGWPENGLPDYDSMQAAVDDGYGELGRRDGVEVVPVGDAWQSAMQGGPALFQTDGVHPTPAGTYLAACVFYAVVFKQSPVGLADKGGLGDSDATRLEQIAAGQVLN